jgi:hypothetical protein
MAWVSGGGDRETHSEPRVTTEVSGAIMKDALVNTILSALRDTNDHTSNRSYPSFAVLLFT